MYSSSLCERILVCMPYLSTTWDIGSGMLGVRILCAGVVSPYYYVLHCLSTQSRTARLNALSNEQLRYLQPSFNWLCDSSKWSVKHVAIQSPFINWNRAGVFAYHECYTCVNTSTILHQLRVTISTFAKPSTFT